MKRRLASIVAALALLAGGTAVALGATGAHHARPHSRAHGGHGLLTSAATYLGVQPSQLRQELHKGQTLAQLAGTTAGKSQAGLEAALLASRDAKVKRRMSELPAKIAERLAHPGARRHSRARGANAAHAAALAYLGISGKQLRSDRRAGKTLAQIADATPGKSAAGLVTVIVDARRARLAKALASGKISKSIAKVRSAHLQQHAHQLASRQRGARQQSH
jgi:hypothetical protein